MTLQMSSFPADVQATLRAYGADLSGVRLAHADSAEVVPPVGAGVLTRAERERHPGYRAPGATVAEGGGNRAVPEAADEFRTCFEKDLDKLQHSEAFRRLAHKCQVFISPSDDHLRTRLSHSFEVAQIAESVARAAGLNAELARVIALGHDCGHGPAGHASEQAFTPYLDGGYDHATYGADVVLAELNLTEEVLDGVRNHSWKRPAPRTPEAEIVSWADRIAYLCHDADDAIRAGIITAEQLPADVREVAGVRQADQVKVFIRGMLDAVNASGRIGMMADVAAVLDSFRKFNYERIYLRPASQRQAEKVIALLQGLVEQFADMPGQLPAVKSGKADMPASGSPEAFALAVRHVSGMTDRYALHLGVELLGYSNLELPRGA